MSTIEQETVPLDKRTPIDWVKILSGRLDAELPLISLYESYYAGEHPLQFATSKFREAFGALFSAFADNWCEIVVDAPVERLQVVGFRTGQNIDESAWEIWQLNQLDAESVIAHTEAGKHGTAYLLVDPNEGDPLERGPRITVEHPSQVVIATDPGDRHQRTAALKRWQGEDELLYATVYLPDAIFKFASKEKPGASEIEWIPRPGDTGGPNSLGVVPIVPLSNKPGLMDGGVSDLRPAVPLQNAVNKLCSDMIVASEYGAFPQRILTGVEAVKDPETGATLSPPLASALSRLLTLENPDSRAWSLPQVDLANFVHAIELFVQHLAAQTRTPPHYLLGQVVNVSGDALKAAEAGLVRKCAAKLLFFSDAWEEAMALALQAGGRDVKGAECQALWADPEQTPAVTLAAAAVQKQAVGVPKVVLWRELGYTPEQIEEMLVLHEQEVQEAEQRAEAAMQRAQDAAGPEKKAKKEDDE